MLTTEKKNLELFELCEQLSFSQRIIFSDEGNLTSKYSFLEQDQRLSPKPKNCVWFSWGRAWIDFLMHESDQSWAKKRISGITHVYEVELDPDRVYFIKNGKDFDLFEKKYATKNRERVYWNKVADRYCGIDIKLQKKTVDDDHWYDGWDCSSGCIWHRDAVKGVKLLKAWEMMWKPL